MPQAIRFVGRAGKPKDQDLSRWQAAKGLLF